MSGENKEWVGKKKGRAQGEKMRWEMRQGECREKGREDKLELKLRVNEQNAATR